MKLTNAQLKRIIREELRSVLKEYTMEKPFEIVKFDETQKEALEDLRKWGFWEESGKYWFHLVYQDRPKQVVKKWASIDFDEILKSIETAKVLFNWVEVMAKKGIDFSKFEKFDPTVQPLLNIFFKQYSSVVGYNYGTFLKTETIKPLNDDVLVAFIAMMKKERPKFFKGEKKLSDKMQEAIKTHKIHLGFLKTAILVAQKHFSFDDTLESQIRMAKQSKSWKEYDDKLNDRAKEHLGIGK